MDKKEKLSLDQIKKQLLDIYNERGTVNEDDLQFALLNSDFEEKDYLSLLEYLNSLGALDEELREKTGDEDNQDATLSKNYNSRNYHGSSFETQFEAGKDEESSLSMYFAEIGKYPLLSKEEEISLSKRIAKGDREAEEELINSNLRLVASIATKYRKMGSSLQYQDIISYGNQGLMTAAKKFDYKKGCRFSTYASFWIKQAITRAIATYGHEIKFPIYIEENLKKIKTARSRLTLKLNREPTFEEISVELKGTFSPQKVEEMLSYDNNVISLDKPTGKDEDSKLEDLQADMTTSPDFSTYKDEDISYALSILSPREKKLVIYRFGLFDESPHTLDEVGKLEGITRERARQIISGSLHKMKTALTDFEKKDD